MTKITAIITAIAIGATLAVAVELPASAGVKKFNTHTQYPPPKCWPTETGVPMCY